MLPILMLHLPTVLNPAYIMYRFEKTATSMVEVFKTNVQQEHEAAAIGSRLSSLFPHLKIDFDLSDCDRILRVEGQDVQTGQIMELLNVQGYSCDVLV